ncbi:MULTISPECIES: hypothetical protein [unclassified Rathayibacter]|uniref:hypothetical protein n=1 Tax=unclassified Rathayibacter TaxID=2609250 RepID=UPI000F4BB2EE|nr:MULTISPECIES: hypothetical protein [unclassified Rathayibacter]ROP50168.1 hypothetical protein EDF45_1577 [Rathayibacter sp. PhB186]ROS53126.1 hypothetical protein EDF44_1577 [Rathayibacter sp. PhB185]TCL83639.1 hypothetical protein EDF49_10368 [Rathayibacter sp. PhB192]TCM29232.1 hypothetical protein EDF43_10368 [Rathayibacter sp. PhB179]
MSSPVHLRAQRIVWGSFLLVVGLLFGAGQIWVSQYQGATYKCMVDGPFSPDAEVSERSGIVVGSAALWPLGRACAWARADGEGTVTTYSGRWPRTLAALGLTLGGLALAVAPAKRRGQPDPHSSH